MDKKFTRITKRMVEEDLRNYPLWLISIELPGLGSATDWTKVYQKVTSINSSVENTVLDNEEIKNKLNIITGVLIYLRPLRKKIIEEIYFRDIKGMEELLEELKISRSTFYKEKEEAIKKIAIALGYL